MNQIFLRKTVIYASYLPKQNKTKKTPVITRSVSFLFNELTL